jgi:hypothetical protein
VVTPDDLNRYFSMARMVLGEDDPALDLDEDQRWAAAIHGKTRELVAQFNAPTASLEAHTRRGPFQPLPGSRLKLFS